MVGGIATTSPGFPVRGPRELRDLCSGTLGVFEDLGGTGLRHEDQFARKDAIPKCGMGHIFSGRFAIDGSEGETA
jgi:hypothetical protein